MSQPDGSYPRLNGAMLSSGKYNGKIVSLVGKFDVSQKHFECCDKMTVELDTAQADGMQIIPGTIAEIVGLVQSPSNLMLFVVRELSSDTNLDVYNKMVTVQHNPKFAHYFTAVGDGTVVH